MLSRACRTHPERCCVTKIFATLQLCLLRVLWSIRRTKSCLFSAVSLEPRLQSFIPMQHLLHTHQWCCKQRTGPTQHVVLGLRRVFAPLLSNRSSKPRLLALASVMSARSTWPAQGARIILGSSSYSRQGAVCCPPFPNKKVEPSLTVI